VKYLSKLECMLVKHTHKESIIKQFFSFCGNIHIFDQFMKTMQKAS